MSIDPKRIVTGVLGIAFIVALIAYGGRWGITILALMGCFGALFEYFLMLFPSDTQRFQQWVGMIAGVGLSFLIVFRTSVLYEGISLFFILLFIFYLAMAHFYEGNQKQLLEDLSKTLMGIFYVAFLFSFWPKIRALPQGVYWIFLVFLIPWLSDTAAYFIGRAYGKRKLTPAISPNKTQEGALAGVIVSIIGLFIYRAFLFKELGVMDCLLIGVGGSVISQLGDLFESFIKRAMDVKDSGVIIPGHGGIMDRFDSVLFCGPFVYFYALLLG